MHCDLAPVAASKTDTLPINPVPKASRRPSGLSAEAPNVAFQKPMTSFASGVTALAVASRRKVENRPPSRPCPTTASVKPSAETARLSTLSNPGTTDAITSPLVALQNRILSSTMTSSTAVA